MGTYLYVFSSTFHIDASIRVNHVYKLTPIHKRYLFLFWENKYDIYDNE